MVLCIVPNLQWKKAKILGLRPKMFRIVFSFFLWFFLELFFSEYKSKKKQKKNHKIYSYFNSNKVHI